MSPSNFCQTKRSRRFLSELMRPHPFVKLNAIEGLGGGAFTFSIFTHMKYQDFHCSGIVKIDHILYNYFLSNGRVL